MRTILELGIEYETANGTHRVKYHTLSPTLWGIYTRIVMIEDGIQRKSERLRNKYIESLEMTKPVWAKSIDMTGSDYSIFIEPMIGALYTIHQRELKAVGLLYAPIGRAYDRYFNTFNCELEQQSHKPIDIIAKETEKVLFDFKKEQKRKVA